MHFLYHSLLENWSKSSTFIFESASFSGRSFRSFVASRIRRIANDPSNGILSDGNHEHARSSQLAECGRIISLSDQRTFEFI